MSLSDDDRKIEKKIVDLGLMAARVTVEQIDALMKEVSYKAEVRPLGSTTTLVHAFLWGTFYLGTGKSHSVSAENYNEEIGTLRATENAEKKARDALWDFEGYVLKKSLFRTGLHVGIIALSTLQRRLHLAMKHAEEGDRVLVVTTDYSHRDISKMIGEILHSEDWVTASEDWAKRVAQLNGGFAVVQADTNIGHVQRFAYSGDTPHDLVIVL